MDFCSTTMHLCSVSLMDSEDVSEGCSDVSSLVLSEEIEIFSEDTDKEMKEIAGTFLEPYQFEPV